MPLEVRTGWVAPPSPIRGLDHLGVQTPCVSLYTHLLPGITNVTDRARYYAFYPWLIWSFEKHYTDCSKESFSRVLRRAECLMTLVAAYHESALSENERDHGVAMVGRQTLRSPAMESLDGQVINLDDYAAQDSSNRYFQNRLGGLGQYYFGPLRDLKILDYLNNDRSRAPGYDEVRGFALAQALDQVVPGKRFFEILENDVVDGQALNELQAFCPCSLRNNQAEHDLLLDIFLARTDDWADGGGTSRRTTLALLLDLIDKSDGLNDLSLTGIFQGAAYSKALYDGKQWNVSQPWSEHRDGWAAYVQNEMLSIAVQGLFWSQLRIIEDQGGSVNTTAEAAHLLSDLVIKGMDEAWYGLTVGQIVGHERKVLPPINEWANEDHEIQKMWSVVRLSDNQDSTADVAGLAIKLLISILARGFPEEPYRGILHASDLSSEDINLLGLQRNASSWADWCIDKWLNWIGQYWCIERHLQVALRKLRGETRDTFRIRPLDGSYVVVEVPRVALTTPRLSRAEQILRDLGLITEVDNGYELTAQGRDILQECRND